VDDQLFRAVNRFAQATPWLHPVVYGYAAYGVALFGGLLLTAWWIARRSVVPARMAAAVAAGIGVMLAVGVNQPLVAAFARPRPYTVHPDLLVLAHRTSDLSFPSDHAVMAGAAAIGLWFVSRRLGAVAVVAAVLMAASRVYIAAHYPGDVLAGLLLGGVVAAAACLLLRPALTRVIYAAQQTRLRPLLAAAPAVARPEPS
jgi:membrane-associated phospholipid phosphatase